MTDFAGMLSRLATHRGLDVSALAQAADAADTEGVLADIPGPQLEDLNEQAHILLHEYADDLPPDLVCDCDLLRDAEGGS